MSDDAVVERELYASLLHDQHCNARRRDGWRWGPVLDEGELMTDPLLVPWSQLDERHRAEYLARVDDGERA